MSETRDEHQQSFADNGQAIQADRFVAPFPTERYPAWWGSHLSKPLDAENTPTQPLVSVISHGPTGVGAVYEMAEPSPLGHHLTPWS